ncbi:MAG: class I SAM-dependent methyltransferase [Dongiaceae bacterium]
MTADAPHAQISPDLFIDSLLGYQKTAALRAALALDLFSIIADSDGTAATLAARTGCAERGIRILCDYFTVIGFLEKHEARYRLTPSTATFLTRGSPAWMGSIADFIASPEMLGLWLEDPVSYVRNGGSPGLANVAANNPVWVKFAKAMVPFIAAPSAAMAAEIGSWRPAPRRVLDIAAGHGMFGIAIAKAVPGAEITALDWPAVLQVAEENAAAAGLAGRYRLQPGSAFEVDWGSDNDAVLLPNFLHISTRRPASACSPGRAAAWRPAAASSPSRWSRTTTA